MVYYILIICWYDILWIIPMKEPWPGDFIKGCYITPEEDEKYWKAKRKYKKMEKDFKKLTIYDDTESYASSSTSIENENKTPKDYQQEILALKEELDFFQQEKPVKSLQECILHDFVPEIGMDNDYTDYVCRQCGVKESSL